MNIKLFKEFKENFKNEYFSLTGKYEELPEDILYPLTSNLDEWLEKTPTHIKLLSIICSSLEFADFELDEEFFSDLENEYNYAGFELTRNEVIESCHKLKEEGYLK